jgi:hypothetical protein
VGPRAGLDAAEKTCRQPRIHGLVTILTELPQHPVYKEEKGTDNIARVVSERAEMISVLEIVTPLTDQGHLSPIMITRIITRIWLDRLSLFHYTENSAFSPHNIPHMILRKNRYVPYRAGIAQSVWRRARRPGFDYVQGQDIYLFPTASRPAMRPDQPHIQWVPGASSLGAKRPGRKVDHSTPSSAGAKKGEPIPPLPNTSSWLSA